jgi:sterol 24-C-methyltransferase
MNVTSYLEQTKSPDERTANYHELVKEYYDSVTFYYWKGWGEHFHFAPFSGSEPLKQALEVQQRLLAREAGIEPGMKVLDVGCGIGGPTRSIARISGARITGVTISPAQVKAAQELTWREGLQDRCQVILGDAMDLDLKDNAFDVVYMIESACHMPDKRAFFRECARVLRPGGRIAGWDWIRTEKPNAGAELIEPICTYFALPGLCTLEEIGEHLTHAGLEVLKTEDMGELGSSSQRWWSPLDRQLGSLLARITSRLSPTLGMMQRSGELLVEAGKAGAFSPLGFFVARKPQVRQNARR